MKEQPEKYDTYPKEIKAEQKYLTAIRKSVQHERGQREQVC